MLHIAGKTLKEACATRAVPARFTCHCYPPNQQGSLKRDCICLIRFSNTLLYCIWTGLALELKLECMSALILIFSFSLSGVLFLFVGTIIFWSILRLMDSS